MCMVSNGVINAKFVGKFIFLPLPGKCEPCHNTILKLTYYFVQGALRITEDGNGGVRIIGASMRPVRGVKEALGALRAGALARTTAATNMNSSSSRSHAVFTLLMRQRRLAPDQDQVDKDAENEAPEQYETLTAKFHFVDLAGSERLKRTGMKIQLVF